MAINQGFQNDFEIRTAANDLSADSGDNIRIKAKKEIKPAIRVPERGKKNMSNDTELHESLLDVRANGDAKVVIERPIFSQQTFDEGFEAGARPNESIPQKFKNCCTKCRCSADCFKNFLIATFPFLTILRGYSLRSDLSGDIVSGLTVGIMHIPQGMAYGMLTGLPPVFGLYTSFFPVIVYFFLGTSNHISIGTFAVASLMVGSAVERGVMSQKLPVVFNCQNGTVYTLDNGTTMGNGTAGLLPLIDECEDSNLTEVQLQWAMAVTLMVGFIQLFMGLTRLGFVTTYLSDPLISGFTTGAACHVFTSQIKHVFGVETERYSGAFKLIYTYRDFFSDLPHTNSITLIASVVCMLFLYLIKEYINNNPKVKPHLKMPVPVELIAVVMGTVISLLIKLDEEFHVKVVGDIPTGFPPPSPPDFSLLPDVISDAFAIAIVVFAVSVSMGKILAKKHDYEINSNQELIAYSATNIVSSFFSAYVSSASLSRSLVQEQVGGKTQITGLISCFLLVFVLLFIGPYFKTLPKCILASIIIIALKGMFRQLLELPRLWKLSKIDFLMWVSTFLATALLDVDLGLLVGVIIALLTIVYRAQRPYVCLLGQMPGTDIYRDLKVYKEAVPLPDIRIFRFENALFFVSVEHFKNSLFKNTCNPRHLKLEMRAAEAKIAKEKDKADKISFSKVDDEIHMNVSDDAQSNSSNVFTSSIPMPKAPFHTIILDCSNWSFIDSMGVKALTSVVNDYRDVNVSVYLTYCKAGIREMFEKTGFFDVLDRDKLFVTIHDAVLFSKHGPHQSESSTSTPDTDGAPTTTPKEVSVEVEASNTQDSETDNDGLEDKENNASSS